MQFYLIAYRIEFLQMLIESRHAIVDRLSVIECRYLRIKLLMHHSAVHLPPKYLRCSTIRCCVMRKALSGCLECYLKQNQVSIRASSHLTVGKYFDSFGQRRPHLPPMFRATEWPKSSFSICYPFYRLTAVPLIVARAAPIAAAVVTDDHLPMQPHFGVSTVVESPMQVAVGPVAAIVVASLAIYPSLD